MPTTGCLLASMAGADLQATFRLGLHPASGAALPGTRCILPPADRGGPVACPPVFPLRPPLLSRCAQSKGQVAQARPGYGPCIPHKPRRRGSPTPTRPPPASFTADMPGRFLGGMDCGAADPGGARWLARRPAPEWSRLCRRPVAVPGVLPAAPLPPRPDVGAVRNRGPVAVRVAGAKSQSVVARW